MLIVLKLACFGLWMAMMLGLCLAGRFGSQETTSVSLKLNDPQRAERDIQLAQARILPRSRLCLEISCQNPHGSELLYIANRMQRKNPSIMIQTDVSGSTLPSRYC